MTDANELLTIIIVIIYKLIVEMYLLLNKSSITFSSYKIVHEKSWILILSFLLFVWFGALGSNQPWGPRLQSASGPHILPAAHQYIIQQPLNRGQ